MQANHRVDDRKRGIIGDFNHCNSEVCGVCLPSNVVSYFQDGDKAPQELGGWSLPKNKNCPICPLNPRLMKEAPDWIDEGGV